MAEPKKTALITGASGGIGEALARLCAKGGFDLVLVARRQDRLDALADELGRASCRVVAADLSDPAAPRAIFDRLAAQGVRVDALINNAGFAVNGAVAEASEARQVEMIQVNVAALAHLTRLFLPPMIARGWGRILNVASVAGFMPGPLMAGYYASKAFVVSYSEALAVELEGTGVAVTTLCPGPTATGFEAAAGAEGTPLFQSGVMAVEPVARAAYAAMMAGRGLIVPGLRNRLLVASTRFTPRRLLARIAKRLNAPSK